MGVRSSDFKFPVAAVLAVILVVYELVRLSALPLEFSGRLDFEDEYVKYIVRNVLPPALLALALLVRRSKWLIVAALAVELFVLIDTYNELKDYLDELPDFLLDAYPENYLTLVHCGFVLGITSAVLLTVVALGFPGSARGARSGGAIPRVSRLSEKTWALPGIVAAAGEGSFALAEFAYWYGSLDPTLVILNVAIAVLTGWWLAHPFRERTPQQAQFASEGAAGDSSAVPGFRRRHDAPPEPPEPPESPKPPKPSDPSKSSPRSTPEL